MTNATQTRSGLALLALIAVTVAAFLLGRAHQAKPAGSEHREARQQVLYFTLSRTDAPIIVLGDSIVEAAMLPPNACGHPLINAGLSGASTSSDLGGWLKPALGAKRAFAIIVLLGVNDALTATPDRPEAFAGRYEALLRELSALTERVYLIETPPVEARERMTPDMAKAVMATLGRYRAVLPDLAKHTGATLLPMPEMPTPFTIDGVHLNAVGYRIWDQAVLQAAALACG
jgi:lysophospholipase L1-like esterase